MPMINRIAAASSGGHVTYAADPRNLDRIEAASTPGTGQFVDVDMGDRRINAMLNKAGVTPPAVGHHLVVTDLDARLTTAGYGIRERMEVKLALQRKGLLPAGRPVRVDY